MYQTMNIGINNAIYAYVQYDTEISYKIHTSVEYSNTITYTGHQYAEMDISISWENRGVLYTSVGNNLREVCRVSRIKTICK